MAEVVQDDWLESLEFSVVEFEQVLLARVAEQGLTVEFFVVAFD